MEIEPRERETEASNGRTKGERRGRPKGLRIEIKTRLARSFKSKEAANRYLAELDPRYDEFQRGDRVAKLEQVTSSRGLRRWVVHFR